MRKMIEAQLGMVLPPQDKDLPPELEIALSSMMAKAANQVVQQNMLQMQQMQAQQQAQDPIIQMQQQELMLRQKELEIKAQKLAIDAAAQADRQELEEEKTKADIQLRAMKTMSDIEKDKALMTAQNEKDGVRLGIDIAKTRAEEARQKTGQLPK
jgi:hypothetical protein